MTEIHSKPDTELLLAVAARIEGPLPQLVTSVDRNETADEYRLTLSSRERTAVAAALRVCAQQQPKDEFAAFASVMATVAPTEEADVKFFLDQWQSAADLEERKALIRSFRRQNITVGAGEMYTAVAALPPHDSGLRASFEAIIASLNYDGADTDSLTVGEIRRALP